MRIFDLTLDINQNKPKVKLMINNDIDLEKCKLDVLREETIEYLKSVVSVLITD